MPKNTARRHRASHAWFLLGTALTTAALVLTACTR